VTGSRKFPDRRFGTIADYAREYFSEYATASSDIDGESIAAAANAIERTVVAGNWIYSCGNGGSAAIANHLLCDFSKGIQTGTALRPLVASLSSPTELLLAIGNDISFSDIFAFQIRSWGKPRDLLIAVSSSGNSDNIVEALKAAKAVGMTTVALTGFEGGRSRQMADISVHVPSRNYGVVEDLHQSIMHMLAQFVRMKGLPPEAVGEITF
jgi:phosphoheptose isomerase